MPEIAPFAALRYNLDKVGSLSDVIAPPYDVIDPDLQNELYDRHDANVIRVILNRPEDGDDDDAKYRRAANFVQQWIQDGTLVREDAPAIYVYHQTFTAEGQQYTRRGFMARVRIQPFGEGNIYPHEETHPKAKVDRLKLTKATGQNNSQIFGLYPDPDNGIINGLDEAIAGQTPVEATDHLGVIHRLWAVTDPKAIDRVVFGIGGMPMFVADGHHRYETASNYRQEQIDHHGGTLPKDHPANFVMTMLVGMSDPGMIVLPTHRLLRGTESFSSVEITAKLAEHFDCENLGGGVEAAAAAWTQMEADDDQSQVALYAVTDQTWVLAKAKPRVTEAMKKIAADRSDDWRGLGVSILHRLVIDELLGLAGHSKPTYVHEAEEVVAALKGEGSQAESDGDSEYTFAALVMPAKLAHVEAISLNKERMPAKSTYFYPKLLSGLTFNPLTEG